MCNDGRRSRGRERVLVGDGLAARGEAVIQDPQWALVHNRRRARMGRAIQRAVSKKRSFIYVIYFCLLLSLFPFCYSKSQPSIILEDNTKLTRLRPIAGWATAR